MTGSATTTPSVNRELLEARIRQVADLMKIHAGAIELLDVSPRGSVRIRFTGMCQGCGFRPLTMHGTVVPALMDVPGVTEVHADGVRISDEAAERMAELVGPVPSALPPLPALPESWTDAA